MLNLLKFKKPTAITQPTATTQPTSSIPEGTTLEQLRDEMLGLVAQESSNHHRMGQLYNYIVENRLAQKAGFKDAQDFVSKQLADLSQSTLTMYGAVADAFTEPVTRRFGVTRLYLLLTYKEAAGLQLNPEQLGDTPIEVPDEKRQVTTMPFMACSVEHMRQALKRKRKPTSSKPLPPEAEARAEQYRKLVTARFPKGTGTRVKVLVRNDKGSAVLDFTGIPLEQVEQLLQALLAMQA